MTAGERPLAEHVAKQLRKDFLKAVRPGGRLPSVRTLADELGVSVLTLRAAQSILAEQGLLEVRHGSGVYLKEQGSGTRVGLYSAFNILQPRTPAFHSHMIHFLREFFGRHGVEAEVYIGGLGPGDVSQVPSNRRFVEDVKSGRLQGIAITNAPRTHGWLRWVERLSIPSVGYNTPYDVTVGYNALLLAGVRDLCAQGCRRIAMLAWGHGRLRKPFRTVLNGCGLDYHDEWVRDDLDPMLSGAGWEEFREVWRARRMKPDGLLVTDELLFDEARIAIQEMGIDVPGRLKIVTHASVGARRRYPFPVTEARVDPQRHAEVLGGMLLKQLRGESVEPCVTSVPVELVETRPVADPSTPRIVPHAVV